VDIVLGNHNKEGNGY